MDYFVTLKNCSQNPKIIYLFIYLLQSMVKKAKR